MPYYVYVTCMEDDLINVFTMDAESGGLTHLRDVAVSGRPAPLAISPDKTMLHVGRRGIPEISSFRIAQDSGDLSFAGTVPVDVDPCYVGIDRRGRFLFSAYYEGARAAVHPLGDDGAVTDPPVEQLSTATGAHCIQADPTNRFVFVPHISGRGPNWILQFRFDQNTGHLTPNSPPQVSPQSRVGPRHFCFHPSLNVVYCSNEQGCSVTGYNLDAAAGTLTAFQTISTLPEGYAGANSCAQIQVDPSGRFLYAPNRGHDSLACYRVNPDDGRLQFTGHADAEPTPRVFSIDPQGRFLYSAGLESGRLAAFSIDQDTGELERENTYPIGRGAMWVLITQLGE